MKDVMVGVHFALSLLLQGECYRSSKSEGRFRPVQFRALPVWGGSVGRLWCGEHQWGWGKQWGAHDGATPSLLQLRQLQPQHHLPGDQLRRASRHTAPH